MQKNKINYIRQLKLAIISAATIVLLVGCNSGGGTNSTSGTDGAGPAIQTSIPANPALFATSGCLSANITTNGSNYYVNTTLNIINSCNTQQSLSGQNISFTSQDTTGTAVAVGSVTNWWINNTSYFITFINGGGNIQTGTIVAGNGSAPTINAGQTIAFSGGFNLNNVVYDNATAAKTITVGGQAPVAQNGNLNITIDTTKAGCTTGADCSNISVAVKDSNGNTMATVKVPSANTNATYSQTVESLPVNTYTLQASTVNGDTIAYIPSATPTIAANTTTVATVTYTQVAAAKTGQAIISLTLPSPFASYNSSLAVKVLDTRNSNAIVGAFSLKNGQAATTAALAVSDATHAYAVQVQGIADPANSLAYVQSGGLQTLNITANTVTPISPTFAITKLPLNKLTVTESGLTANDTANISFQDATARFAYVSYTKVGNGNKTYYFESGLNLAYIINASGTNYQTNPISGTIVMTTLQTLNATFVQKVTPTPGTATVAGWPAYLAMGAIGGPNIDPTNITSGDDGFARRPIDAVFKYAGVNGNGDPGVIDPPMNAIRMTKDLTLVSSTNKVPSRAVIVEYTGEMSGGENFSDFTNSSIPDANKQGATYIMARHFASLGADAIALADQPVVYNGRDYYGSLIMNPDLLGAIQQNNYTASVNAQLPAGAVNTAVDQALCLLTNIRSYTNNDSQSITDWSGQSPRKDSYGKTYTGTPYSILKQMLNDTFPAWIISSASDQYWGVGIDNMIQGTTSYSQVGSWLNACIANPAYDQTKYAHPSFPAGFDGWVQANNWLIRTFAAKGTVTFGWQDNMWAASSGFWMHNDLTNAQIGNTYSTPLANWLTANAPSAINNVGSTYAPDYFVFDRYEMDDSAAPGQATLYSARSWDNFLTAVGLVSKRFNNIPVMLWQIPGSHIPYTGEANPEYFNNTPGSYIFSTAPVYFFGDNNLKPDLSNMIMGSGSGTNSLVGNFMMSILSPTDITDGYHCPSGACTNYQQYLTYYNGKTNNYDWSKDNGKLALAAQNNVFAILWGGGNTTNVIKNFSNPDDHGWLADKIINYYKNPQLLAQ